MKTRTLQSGRTIAVHDNRGLYKRCACARRKWSSCLHSWTLAFKWQGTLHRLPLDRAVGRHVSSREDAKREADRLRTLIRDGKSPLGTPTAETPSALTFEQFGALWLERARVATSEAQQANDRAQLRRLGGLTIDGERLGDRPIGRITEDDLETAFVHVAHLAASTQNKLRQALLHLQRFGTRKGYLTRSWLTADSELKRKKGARRERRLEPDELAPDGSVRVPGEERRLLAHATLWLANLITAALETACRRGELLSLQWRDVSLARREITLRAEKTKTRELRRIPISAKLAGVLDMLRLDPTGAPHGPDAYVFGDRIGRRIADPKKAWAKACRLAGIVDLKLHDLRHEAASRLLEAGWPLQHVQAQLGHADAKTTSIYTNTTLQQLHDSMRRFGTQPFHVVSHGADPEPRPLGNSQIQTDRKSLVN